MILVTSTGEYSIERIDRLSKSLAKQREGAWFDQEDIKNDLIALLLAGDHIIYAFSHLMKKYKPRVKCTNIECVPEKYLIDHSTEDKNERILSPEDREKVRKEYMQRLNRLDALSQDILMMRMTGIVDKEIAKTVGLTYANVRVKIHRAIVEMRGMR